METRQIALIGLSYRTTPIVIREQLSCSVASLPELLLGSNGRFPTISELVILSTCNRVELYAAVEPHLVETQELLATLLGEIAGVDTAVFVEHTYFHTDQEAADYLLRVATGLDSLVLGEPQILGQVTNAYMSAVEAKTIGPVLTELFRAAIRSGKRARTETNISHNPMSTSSIAIAQAQKLVGDLSHHNCLIVGLGEMGRLAFKGLQARGVNHISLANRTYERAAGLARQNGCRAYRWQDLPLALANADIVISATGAAQAIISAEDIRAVMAGRPQRPLILLDIAVPRDIAPDVAQIPGVTLWDADQLKGSLDEALAARRQEVPKVERIIATENEALMAQLRVLTVKPVIVNLREKAENIRQHELQRMLNHLSDVDPETLQQLQIFSRSLVNKLLHDPTIRLKIRASHDEANVYAAAISDLFDLDQQPAGELENL